MSNTVKHQRSDCVPGGRFQAAVFLQIQMKWEHLIAVREIVSVSLFTSFLIRPRRLHTPVVLLATDPLAPT